MISKEVLLTLHEKELKAYQFVECNKETAGYMRIRELAERCEVSTATIIRLIKKLGFDNYNEFKYWCKDSQKETIEVGEAKEIIECLEKLDSTYYAEQIEEAVDIIEASDLVIFVGLGNSGGTAHYGARAFTNAGRYALCQDDPFYNTSCIKGNPIIIVMSVSGETKELVEQVNGYLSQGCSLICITSSAHASIAKLADFTIAYHLKYRAIQPVCDFSSQVPAVYIIEMLMKELLKRLG